MKVLVTGGTGFIGSALLRHLLAANYEVRILARHKKSRFLIEDLDVEIFEGDITNAASVEKAVSGCQVVFDLASVYTFYPFWDRQAKSLYKINVQGTVNMLNAALKYKVQKFIHTSTIATIGKEEDGKPSNEDTGFEFKKAIHYARSKYLAEQEVLNYCRKGLSAVILNPAIAIGERDYKPTPSGRIIVNYLNRRYPGYFDTTWAVADVDDVARAHISAIENGRVGERYILCNRKHYTLREVFTLLEKISGIKAPAIKISYPLLLGFSYIEELLSYTVLKKRPVMPSEGVRFCRMTAIYDNSKALKELQYNPTPFEETLSKAVSWYRKNGYIEPRGYFRLKPDGSKKVRFIMQKSKMHKYTDKLSVDTLVFYLFVVLLQFLQKIGIKPGFDGWRKTTQSYLRTEHSKFMLTAFRLDFWSDLSSGCNRTFEGAKAHLIERLSVFMREQPQLYWKISWHKFYAQRKKIEYCDLASVEFAENGSLKSIQTFFVENLSDELQKVLIAGIIRHYNETRNISDKKRPLALKNELDIWLLTHPQFAQEELRHQAQNFIDRVLSSAFIQFEELPKSADALEEKRFRQPCFIKSKHPGFGLLNIMCRFTADFKEADLWFQYSHMVVDGVPMQEILNSLKRQWGKCGELKFIAPDEKKNTVPELCSTRDSKKGVYQLNDFVDFQSFIRLRRQLNKRYSSQLKGNITVAALFIWELSKYPVFEDIKFAVPVDLRATKDRERTVGFVFIRPSSFLDKDRLDKGFIKFQLEFNRQIKNAVRRRSEGYKLLEGYALLPPFLFSATTRFMRPALSDFVGTLGVTIIKKADLFIGPFSDVHTDGFIAISNLLVPAQDNSRVCSVSIKGPRKKIEAYMKAIKEVASISS